MVEVNKNGHQCCYTCHQTGVIIFILRNQFHPIKREVRPADVSVLEKKKKEVTGRVV